MQTRILPALVLILAAGCMSGATARVGSSHSPNHGVGHGSYANGSSHAGGHHKASGVKRDKHGKIARSGQAKAEFKKHHPCPSTGKSTGTCPGYVIDHVRPLKRGGADDPSNMQWQTKAAAKAKDQTE